MKECMEVFITGILEKQDSSGVLLNSTLDHIEVLF